MLRIVLAATRPEIIHAFAEYLSSDPEVHLQPVASGAAALNAVRTSCPHLVVIDSDLPDTTSLSLVPELIMANAMVNTAVVSSLSEEDFHEASEGLGVLARLPVNPGRRDASELLRRLKEVLGEMK